MKNKNIPFTCFKFSLLVFLMFISALNYNLFISKIKIVAGGVNGVSIILNYLFGFNAPLTILIISVGILLIAIILSEYQIAFSALLASIIYPFFVEITSNVSGLILINDHDVIVVSIFSGIISGLVTGLLCKLKISQGGFIVIPQVLYKKYKISISKFNTFINLIIIIFGGFVFGINNMLYAIIFIYCSHLVMDKIILGTSQKKIFHIITYKNSEVEEYIKEVLGTGYTTFKAKGAYGLRQRTVIMSTVSNRDYFKLKEGIHQIDSDAFMVITDSYQVKGGK